eukprot:evm.model.scf_1258.6 EVM.evm.TU.scf_1258.6   scf_1258:36755-37709(+)
MKRKAPHQSESDVPEVESIRCFAAKIADLKESLRLASMQEIYCAYSRLLSMGKVVELRSSEHFHYFLAGPKQLGTSSGSRWEEVVVPISSKYGELSIDLLGKIFGSLADCPADRVVLGMVDRDGSVTMYQVFDAVVPPVERSGEACTTGQDSGKR